MSSFKPTTKTQEALQTALQQASANGNPDIRPAHLLAAILGQEDGIAAPVLRATGVDPETVRKEAEALVKGYPKAEGSGLANSSPPKSSWPPSPAGNPTPPTCSPNAAPPTTLSKAFSPPSADRKK